MTVFRSHRLKTIDQLFVQATAAWSPDHERQHGGFNRYIKKYGVFHMLRVGAMSQLETRISDISYMSVMSRAWPSAIEPLSIWRIVGLDKLKMVYLEAAGNLPTKKEAVTESMVDTIAWFNILLYEGAFYDVALPFCEWAWAANIHLKGEEHPDTVVAYSDLGIIYQHLGRYQEAEPLLREALTVRDRVLSTEDPHVALSCHVLGGLYLSMERYEEAEPLLRRAAMHAEQFMDPNHPEAIKFQTSLGVLYEHQGRYDDAQVVYLHNLERIKDLLPPNHPILFQIFNGLATTYQGVGDFEQAETLLLQIIHDSQLALGDRHPLPLTYVYNLGRLYEEQGRFEEAESVWKSGLAKSEAFLGPENPDTEDYVRALAQLYFIQGRYPEALPLCNRAFQSGKRTNGLYHESAMSWLYLIGIIYAADGNWEYGEAIFQRVIEVRTEILGADNPETIVVMESLGRMYVDQGRYDEAKQTYTMALKRTESESDGLYDIRLQLLNHLGWLAVEANQQPDENYFLLLQEHFDDPINWEHHWTRLGCALLMVQDTGDINPAEMIVDDLRQHFGAEHHSIHGALEWLNIVRERLAETST